MRIRLGAAVVAVVLGTPACFVFKRPKSDASAVVVRDGEFALTVTNHNYLDVVIYVLHDGQVTRAGTVTGSSAATFYLPGRLLGIGREIRLLGDAIGSTAVARTETLIIQPGQHIEWTLETDLARSSVGVF
jgi:hypothetical protein